ncbi:MAG: hypothetical protein A2V90_04645 [Gammaproteobacteria bacterium RBG_16_57_12]|nr:MAG: hypothetical protein A2V90_04645 [Gammaproteobacteria bacterium RBG_16_57_12]
MNILNPLKSLWRALRQASGDDAHERYLAHWTRVHGREGGQPMDCETFFKAEQARKWEGVKRCC